MGRIAADFTLMTGEVEAAILTLLAADGAGRSVSPEGVARLVDPQDWRRRLPQVRSAAVSLAKGGRLEIIRHGKTVDPEAFKGVYRLRLPLSDGQDRAA